MLEEQLATSAGFAHNERDTRKSSSKSRTEHKRSQIREAEAQSRATRLEIERQRAEERKLREEIGEHRRALASLGRVIIT